MASNTFTIPPDQWFFIRSVLNNHVVAILETEAEARSQVYTLRQTFDLEKVDYMLWKWEENGFIVNKKTGLVLDIRKGESERDI